MDKISYNKVTKDIVEQLSKACNGHVLTGDQINDDFCHDEMRIYGTAMPDVVVEAETTEEVAAVMKICMNIRSRLHHPVPVRIWQGDRWRSMAESSFQQ